MNKETIKYRRLTILAGVFTIIAIILISAIAFKFNIERHNLQERKNEIIQSYKKTLTSDKLLDILSGITFYNETSKINFTPNELIIIDGEMDNGSTTYEIKSFDLNSESKTIRVDLYITPSKTLHVSYKFNIAAGPFGVTMESLSNTNNKYRTKFNQNINLMDKDPLYDFLNTSYENASRHVGKKA